MATQTLKNVILQLRTGSATQWAASTRILAVGEPGVETDSGRIKIGDGTNLWSALPWSGAAISKSGTNGSLTVNGADVVVYSLPTATSDTLGGSSHPAGPARSPLTALRVPPLWATWPAQTGCHHHGL